MPDKYFKHAHLWLDAFSITDNFTGRAQAKLRTELAALLRRVAEEAATTERVACAAIAETCDPSATTFGFGEASGKPSDMRRKIVAAIRSRSTSEQGGR